MIAASLAVITTVLALVAGHEVGLRRAQIRSQGVGLVSALSRVPLDRLVPSTGQLGTLPLIRATQKLDDFAYAIIVDPTGETLGAVSGPDSLTPPLAPPSVDPVAWTTERVLALGSPPVLVREFLAPILTEGQLSAQVRIGYLEPSYSLVLRQTSLHAKIALVVFLLIPLASSWLRRELKPLDVMSRELDATEAQLDRPYSAELSSGDGDGTLVDRFRSFSAEIERNAGEMERQKMALLASTKVLAHRKNRIEEVFEAVPDALLSIDETGTLTIANARAEKLLRSTQEQLTGSQASDWAPDPAVAQLIRGFAGAQGKRTRSESVEYDQPGAESRRILASVHPLSDSSGAVVMLRDITSEYAAKLTQAEFLAHMAHELKAPLNVMSMYSETLLGPEASEERFRVDACNVLRDEIDRLNALINNIFSIGRIESGIVSIDRQRVKTAELLADIFQATTREASKNDLECVLDLAENLRPIYADKQLLSVAVKNLMSNAIKYNKPGGRLTLSAAEDAEGLVIRVADTGFGIPEDEVDQVFEKFFRSEDDSVRKVSGHGLGLAIVKEIIVLHGGEMRVKSEHGAGTEFSILFSHHSAVMREEK